MFYITEHEVHGTQDDKLAAAVPKQLLKLGILSSRGFKHIDRNCVDKLQWLKSVQIAGQSSWTCWSQEIKRVEPIVGDHRLCLMLLQTVWHLKNL